MTSRDPAPLFRPMLCPSSFPCRSLLLLLARLPFPTSGDTCRNKYSIDHVPIRHHRQVQQADDRYRQKWEKEDEREGVEDCDKERMGARLGLWTVRRLGWVLVIQPTLYGLILLSRREWSLGGASLGVGVAVIGLSELLTVAMSLSIFPKAMGVLPKTLFSFVRR
jgi:hypothetical protein